MTFGGNENRPIMVDDKVLFFNEPELASAALGVANPDMKSFGPCPEEVAAIYNISEMLQLIETADIDETATIVDCLNIFDDLLEAVKQPLSPDYKRILYVIADHLTFHREFGTFLEEQHIDRTMLREAIKWCIETVFSRSKFDSSVVANLIRSSNFTEVQRLIQEALTINLSEAHQRQATLLAAAVKAAQAKTFFEWRHAHQKLVMLIAEYAYQGSQMMDDPDLELQRVALELYWHYRIILAREEGVLPAWEGIRLVRERKDE